MIKRAAEHELVMAAIEAERQPTLNGDSKFRPCPKPVREQSERSRKRALELQLDDVSRRLVAWRDGACAEFGLDNCFGQLQWGHLFPQTECRFVRWTPGFAFRQCEYHNQLHTDRTQNHVYYGWFARRWGAQAWLKTNAYAHSLKGQKHTMWELEELLEHLTDMWGNRPSTYSLSDLVLRGYYGDIIRELGLYG